MGKLCQLLEISRSGYYAWLRGGGKRPENGQSGPAQGTGAPAREIPCLGLDSLYHMLKPVFHCSRGRVHRLMKAAGIHSQRKRAYKATTNSRHNCPIAPNLLQRQFTFSRPNQAWVGDITYIPTGEGWLYFAIVKDLCTRKIVGYAFSQRIDTQLTLDALNMAVRRERPAPGLIFHSDRGVQYAAAAFRERLDSLGIRQSMSRKGRPLRQRCGGKLFQLPEMRAGSPAPFRFPPGRPSRPFHLHRGVLQHHPAPFFPGLAPAPRL